MTSMLEQALKADPERYGEPDFELARKIYSAAIKGNPPPECFFMPGGSGLDERQ
ncbi:hypothetical protein [Chromobacterium sp. LK1]|uniref:hypothetical protein n=1 Tax=Chromobacterium sp. LK1 TaxID=1628193 RepID=UPI001E56B7B3|nr:hypothetical protein [Chromobacterium sp. LK1]